LFWFVAVVLKIYRVFVIILFAEHWIQQELKIGRRADPNTDQRNPNRSFEFRVSGFVKKTNHESRITNHEKDAKKKTWIIKERYFAGPEIWR